MKKTLDKKNILLIICGGIAAYKSLDLIRRLRERGANVNCILTASGEKFITRLSVESLSANSVKSDLFADNIAHINLARQADVIVVAPATANFIAKMANGIADDLASSTLLATKVPVLIAPAMNPAMWRHAATKRNLAKLKKDGIYKVGPIVGEMAESNEAGLGRFAETIDIIEGVESICGVNRILYGKQALVTAGATREALDPIRFLSNHSSGKQGYAIAEQLSLAGCKTLLVHGATSLELPYGVEGVAVDSAKEMLEAVHDNMPDDIAIFAAAVADWRAKKISKQKAAKEKMQKIELIANEDILANVGKRKKLRPKLVVGFAAQTINKGETKKMVKLADEKRKAKNADWMLANNVSKGTNVFGSEYNDIHFINNESIEAWGRMTKKQVARKLVGKISNEF